MDRCQRRKKAGRARLAHDLTVRVLKKSRGATSACSSFIVPTSTLENAHRSRWTLERENTGTRRHSFTVLEETHAADAARSLTEVVLKKSGQTFETCFVAELVLEFT